MPAAATVRVGVNGYGVIGKRVAAAATRQDDMSLVGVSDLVTDWRARMVVRNGFVRTNAVLGLEAALI